MEFLYDIPVIGMVIQFVVYVIVDLEFPRYGLIRIDTADEVMVELRRSMN